MEKWKSINPTTITETEVPKHKNELLPQFYETNERFIIMSVCCCKFSFIENPKIAKFLEMANLSNIKYHNITQLLWKTKSFVRMLFCLQFLIE